MEMHQIRYFLAVERLKNFSRAAAACNITQPALTRAIQKLEDCVGGKLFHRRPGHIELTELGRAMLPRLEAAYREIAQAHSDATALVNQRKQRLRLGIMCTIGPDRLVSLLHRLHAAIPDLDLEIIEAKGNDVLAALVEDQADAALVGLPHYPEHCEVRPLYEESYVLAFPNGHRFADLNAVSVADLDGEDYIERTNCEFDDHFDAKRLEWPVELRLRYRCGREDWVQAMISARLGIAILPQSFPLLPGVLSAPLIGPQVTRTIALVTIKDREEAPVMRPFLATLAAHSWA